MPGLRGRALERSRHDEKVGCLTRWDSAGRVPDRAPALHGTAVGAHGPRQSGGPGHGQRKRYRSGVATGPALGVDRCRAPGAGCVRLPVGRSAARGPGPLSCGSVVISWLTAQPWQAIAQQGADVWVGLARPRSPARKRKNGLRWAWPPGCWCWGSSPLWPPGQLQRRSQKADRRADGVPACTVEAMTAPRQLLCTNTTRGMLLRQWLPLAPGSENSGAPTERDPGGFSSRNVRWRPAESADLPAVGCGRAHGSTVVLTGSIFQTPLPRERWPDGLIAGTAVDRTDGIADPGTDGWRE